MGNIKVHSGNCCLCDIGRPTGHYDMNGKPLHTGDIVLVYRVCYPGTDHELWDNTGSLTVVVSDQYQSFSSGTVKVSNPKPVPFVMGIKGSGFNNPEWQIQLVKSFSDVVEGEHWPAYGFSYRQNDAAEIAWGDHLPDQREADEIAYGLREEDLP